MIDTYVYFVSYTYTDIKGNMKFANYSHNRNFKIKDICSISELCGWIELQFPMRNNVVIINFQLLDSYNKEERGKE